VILGGSATARSAADNKTVAQEINCKIIRTVIDYAREHGGDRAVERIVELGGGDSLERLTDENHWISHDAEKAIFRALADIVGDARAAERAGSWGVNNGSFGALETFVRALLRPANVYGRIPYVATRIAKVGRMVLADSRDGFARMEYRYFDGFESIQEICDNRKGMLAAIPEIWGLPQAEVTETHCSARGADACAYEIRWEEPSARRMGLWGAVIGASLGLALVACSAAGWLTIATGWVIADALALTALGFSFGRGLQLRKEAEFTRDVVRRQNSELSSQLINLEGKYREIEAFNVQLEDLVAVRTEQLEHELDRLRRLNDLSRDLGATLVGDEIVAKAVRGLRDLVGGEGSALFPTTLQDVEPQLDMAGVDDVGDLGPYAREFLDTEELWTTAQHEGHAGLWLRLESPAGTMGALGIVRAGDGSTFSDRDVAIARTYAEIVVAALSNSALFQETQRLSVTDGLTGLYVHRYFYEALRGAVERSERYGHPFVLLMADVDNFKAVNDTHGHQTGDAVLRAVGEAMKGELRKADIAARNGGEEFAAILPHTTMEEGQVVAERIRQAIAAARVAADGGEEVLGVTVSIGLTQWTAGRDHESVVRAADGALYAAKRSGKNRVVSVPS